MYEWITNIFMFFSFFIIFLISSYCVLNKTNLITRTQHRYGQLCNLNIHALKYLYRKCLNFNRSEANTKSKGSSRGQYPNKITSPIIYLPCDWINPKTICQANSNFLNLGRIGFGLTSIPLA